MAEDDLNTRVDCDHCGKPMIIAPPPTGHYCSPACRVRAFRARRREKAPVKPTPAPPAKPTPQPGTTAAKLAEYERLVAAGRQAVAGLMKSGVEAEHGDDTLCYYADGEPLKDRLGRNITVDDVDEVAVALHRIRKVLKVRSDLDAGTHEGGVALSFRNSIFEDDDEPQRSDLRLLALDLDFVADELDAATSNPRTEQK